MYYHIWTVGCQMNKADSERMALALEGLGLRGTEDIKQAEVVVLNSCSVRQSAEQRVLSKLGSLKHLKRQRQGVTIILAGCMVGDDEAELRRRLPYVDAFVKPADVDGVLTAVRKCVPEREAAPGEARGRQIAENQHLEPTVPADRLEQGRSAAAAQPVTRWVPIIYGCNNFCSYCIVPYRRGRERSRPVEEVVAEVRGFVADGAREVTLLGQNVDSYGRDLPARPDLADLLQELNGIDGLYRVRFLTSHPKDMTDRLIRAVASLPKVCEHINLPVQHGDDDILRAMRRGYTSQQYRDLVGRIRSAIPQVSLSTDVIVGFPGESPAQFERTFELLRELRFDTVHAAMYSPRPGTRAASLPDDVPPEEKKRRLALVEQLQEAIAAETNQGLVGTTVEVLVEDLHKGKWQGRTRSNRLVFIPADSDLRGRLVAVKIESATAWSLQGTPVTPSADLCLERMLCCNPGNHYS